ncbi:hypothetical protein IQ06DRAFT_39662 [Phaeosphaeriaceae sp. SRC1lsM3a]|nr:hypothetical protein IQ06DRAFT_39662 [Stagonospora sp. SRC1lsM3a]
MKHSHRHPVCIIMVRVRDARTQNLVSGVAERCAEGVEEGVQGCGTGGSMWWTVKRGWTVSWMCERHGTTGGGVAKNRGSPALCVEETHERLTSACILVAIYCGFPRRCNRAEPTTLIARSPRRRTCVFSGTGKTSIFDAIDVVFPMARNTSQSMALRSWSRSWCCRLRPPQRTLSPKRMGIGFTVWSLCHVLICGRCWENA